MAASALSPRLHNLQALRGVACLLVVFLHLAGREKFSPIAGLAEYHILFPFLWFGYSGVDLFFVLSGFVITWAHLDACGDRTRLAGYLRNRFLRIYPIYWVCWCATIPAYLLIVHWGWYLRPHSVLKCLLLIPSVDGNPFIPQAWTLTFEVLFYTAFAGFFLLPRRAFVPILSVWLVTIIVVALRASTALPAGAVAQGFARLLSPQVAEFIFGCLAATGVRRGWVRAAPVILIAGLVWFAAGAAADAAGWIGATQGWSQVIQFGAPSALIIYGAAAVEVSRRWVLPGWLQAVGEASYSLYLVHVVVFDVADTLTAGLGHELPRHLLWIGMLLAAAIGMGFLTHFAVERPLQRMLRRRPAPAQLPAAIRRAA